MKKKRKKFTFLVLALVLIGVNIGSTNVKAYDATSQSSSRYCGCGLHDNCTGITFKSTGIVATGEVTECYFTDAYSHWPNNIEEVETDSYRVESGGCYWGYATGTFKHYASIGIAWFSGTIASRTETIEHVY